MISVAAIRMQQFGVQFYQASLTASDIDKLVRFEVLSYRRPGAGRGSRGQEEGRPPRSTGTCSSAALRRARRRISARSSGKKIEELVQYYEQCRQARDLPSIPGAVIISCRREADVRAGRAGFVGRPAESARARRHPARDRRPAPSARVARRHRQLRRRAVHRAGDHLRPSARRPHRADVCDDQREAHAVERVASGLAVWTPAIPRRGARRRARRRPRAQRSRRIAAAR